MQSVLLTVSISNQYSGTGVISTCWLTMGGAMDIENYTATQLEHIHIFNQQNTDFFFDAQKQVVQVKKAMNLPESADTAARKTHAPPNITNDHILLFVS